MFDGVPSDQFHQFVAAAAAAAASSTTSQLQPPPPSLSFPLHVSSSTFPSFDLYPSGGGGGGGAAAAHQPLQVPHLLHPLHHNSSAPHKDDQDKEENALVSINLEPQKERSMLDLINPWSNDEVLALLRIRSSMENWYPDFTWEHVSRSLHSIFHSAFHYIYIHMYTYTFHISGAPSFSLVINWTWGESCS